ncbi:MAG TPA: hypothetical protein VM142_09750 [Acidimicrobiales bacterium]|nr:hypothetical protein [Acidimicrobiales bacterium]
MDGAGAAAESRRPVSRPILTGLTLAALAAGSIVGSNAFAIRDRLLGTALPDPVAPATSREAGQRTSGERLTLRSAPWWQIVTTLEGTGSTMSKPFTIDHRAVDWRVTSSCDNGHLVVASPGEARPLVDSECPKSVGHSNRKGSTRLEVSADGAWTIEVAQRMDIPLVEPPRPAMTASGAKALATGSFYKVDRVGAGEVTIYEEPDGGYSVRLEDFWVTPKSSLQLRLSTAERPRSTKEYLSGDSQILSVMDVTAGSINYVPPVGVDPVEFRSVVIWSPLDNHVYAAATLEAVA